MYNTILDSIDNRITSPISLGDEKITRLLLIMIQPQELRLGNLLNATKGNDTIQVKVKGIENKTIRTAIFNISVENLHGIPLTEEWLVRLNLEKNVYSDEWIPRYNLDDSLTIHIDRSGDHAILFEGNTLTYIRFVHQLQNLFFTLTGQELLINPK